MEPFTDAHASAARRILAGWPACDRCLGRAFGKVGTGLGNDARGRMLREQLGAPTVPVGACALCEGLLGELDALAALVVERLGDLEFKTFLIGTRVDEDLVGREALAHAQATNEAEAITSELNREVGKRVAALTGKEADLKKPDVQAVVDTRFDVVELQVAPLFLYGRYRKNVRDLPQTKWPCRRCKGLGCIHCSLTGKQYASSVQELIQAPALAAFRARDADFHGMGREDIDARCLGTGRPFVLELKEPRTRACDLQALEQAMNANGPGQVEVLGLRASQRDEVAWVKAADAVKEYRARVVFEADVDQAKLYQAVAGLRSRAVDQRTPSRVEHRRAMLTRQRTVHDIAVEQCAPGEALLRVQGEAGLYIKELVSGDGGRTRPSLTELLGVQARVTELDVVGVQEPPRSAPSAEQRRAQSQSSASR
ncbi:MAG: tRNA pseudouridine(54/55) synthase Pus10 [Halobacteriales archaeon]|nr:tRNA pseudouridine(54/55) synthase Pus10 [Halobacteriales archaeon]